MYQHHTLVAALVEGRQRDLRTWRPARRRPGRWVAVTAAGLVAVQPVVALLVAVV